MLARVPGSCDPCGQQRRLWTGGGTAPAPAAETNNELNLAEEKSEGLACSVMEHDVLLSIDPVATCGEAAALIGLHQQALCDVEYSFSTAKSISDGQDVLDEVWLRAPRS